MNKDKLFFLVQALLRYFPYKLGLKLRQVLYPAFFKHFGKNVRIFDSVVIKYPSDMSIGDNVTINQFCYIAAKGGLTIGNDVMIGSGTKMTTSGHDFADIKTPMRTQGISFEPIEINDDVWFGFNAIVLGGTTIKRGCIIASSCVVTGGTIEELSIVGGVPAKLIRYRS